MRGWEAENRALVFNEAEFQLCKMRTFLEMEGMMVIQHFMRTSCHYKIV